MGNLTLYGLPRRANGVARLIIQRGPSFKEGALYAVTEDDSTTGANERRAFAISTV